MNVNALVLTGNGTNCETETAFAIKKAGADKVVVSTVWDLMKGEIAINDFNFLALPGGFMDGDHLGSAKAAAHRFKWGKPENNTLPVMDQINALIDSGGLIIGICNGFQLLVKLGLLPLPQKGQTVTLTENINGRFEDRWVKVKVNSDSPSVFTKNMDYIDLPVRHGEGRIVFKNPEIQKEIKDKNLIPLNYCDPKTLEPTEQYPYNPNGSPDGVAALTDETGRIFGLMPHPEAFTHKTNHPKWTRLNLPDEGMGLKLFKNGIDYLKLNG